ncbi:MAG: YdcF family protein [Anaeromyxobacter sp.]
MFLLLSKVLDLLLAPLTWAVLLVLCGAWLQPRRPRLSRALLLAAAAGLLTFSVEPVPRLLWRALEDDAVNTFRPDPPYDAVILLGGMVDSAAARASSAVELTESADRLLAAEAVLRSGQARYLLISAGVQAVRPGEPSEAEQLASLLVARGIPRDQLVLDGRSRNTRENALESSRLVAEHGWKRLLVVTSAGHMPRALGCFRAVGLHPDALPVDRRAGDQLTPWYWRLTPRAEQLSASTDAIRELSGRLVYRVAGYTR